MDTPKFYWTASAGDQEIVVTFYREVMDYDQREREYYPSGKKITTKSFSPSSKVKQEIEAWAKREKEKYLTENAAGIVATGLKGKNYV